MSARRLSYPDLTQSVVNRDKHDLEEINGLCGPCKRLVDATHLLLSGRDGATAAKRRQAKTLTDQTPPSEIVPASASAPLANFATLCQQLADTTKKLEKRSLMAAYLASITLADAARASLYLAGVPFAETDLRRLQVGGSTLSKAVAQLSGARGEAMQAAYRRYGDLGDAAFELLAGRAGAGGTALTLAALEAALTALAAARGPAAKLHLLLNLLAQASPLEARYIIKLASGDMRTGVKQSLVEEAVAACYAAETAAVRRAVMLNGNLSEVVVMAAAGTLATARMRLFHPLGFMLASPVDTVDEALARFAEEVALEVSARLPEGNAPLQMAGSAAEPARQLPPTLRAAQLEDKYDGMRAQLHCGDATQPGRVGLFSRNREDIAESFPELIEAFAGFGEEAILDGEILAWQPFAPSAGVPEDPGDTLQPGVVHPERSSALGIAMLAEQPVLAQPAETNTSIARQPGQREGSWVALDPERTPQGRALPFSSLQPRLGRKRVSAEMRAATPVVFMAFDLLYHRGELLLERPLHERRARLEALVSAHAATTVDGVTAAREQATLFAAEEHQPRPGLRRLLLAPAVQLADAAQLDAAYTEARARGNEGVMLKAAGSLYQPGRRGLAWLKLKRELATLDVVITGAEFGNGRRAGVLSDYTFAVRGPAGELLNVGKAYSGLTDAEIDTLSCLLQEQTLEDYGHFRTVEPIIVLEVAFNNVMRSERHASGFALRFPRILRIRDDKPVEEIDTLARVEEIYGSQPDKPVEG